MRRFDTLKRVAVTGAKGTIGQVLISGLRGYEITPIDLPEVDVRDYDSLVRALPGNDSVVHLAWDTETENAESGIIEPDNLIMAYNVYRAAMQTGVPRVVMASSVHADKFSDWKGPEFSSPNKVPIPDSPYGASKIFMEALGRYYATRGLQVICIRFGGVLRSKRLPHSADELLKAVWLSHRDCVELIWQCLEAEKIPENYLIVYGVSDNATRIHDWTNPLGWTPKDKSVTP